MTTWTDRSMLLCSYLANLQPRNGSWWMTPLPARHVGTLRSEATDQVISCNEADVYDGWLP